MLLRFPIGNGCHGIGRNMLGKSGQCMPHHASADGGIYRTRQVRAMLFGCARWQHNHGVFFIGKVCNLSPAEVGQKACRRVIGVKHGECFFVVCGFNESATTWWLRPQSKYRVKAAWRSLQPLWKQGGRLERIVF